jgi:hypothetical protein
MATDLFASFGRFGDRVLVGIDNGDRRAQKFKYLIGVINQTLVVTHGIVLDRLAKIGLASTVTEVVSHLEAMRQDELAEAFRIEGLCDALGGLGDGLTNRLWSARNDDGYDDPDLADVEHFARVLYDREHEVAGAYAATLSQLTGRIPTLNEANLPSLLSAAKQLESTLTSHVADFSAKAERLMRVSQR